MQKRLCTRSHVWQNTDATIKVQENIDHKRVGNITIKGKVENLGASGMFLLTNEQVPVPAPAEITINFNPDSNRSDFLINASGTTVRATQKGVGIKFTSIDLMKLQQCIIRKINHFNASECETDRHLLTEAK